MRDQEDESGWASREAWVRLLARRRERLAVFLAHPGLEDLAAEAQALVEVAERRVAEFDGSGAL